MSKLVDKERLAKLAKALDQRMKAAVNAEEQRALAAEAKALEDAIKAAEEKDAVLADRIAALEGLVVGGEGEGLEAVIGDVAQNKADIAELKEFKDAHSHDEFAKQADLLLADEKAQAAKDAIDAFMSAEAIKEGAVDTLKEIQQYIESDGAAAEEMVANIAALQEFVAGHKDFDASEIEADIVELQEAMANKVEQGAIDAAVEGLASEADVKAILGNVVSSLSLAIVDNKVKLSLGSEADGIAIAEVELDMANDDDIDEIIAGLDE